MNHLLIRILRWIPPGTPGKARLAAFFMKRGFKRSLLRIEDRLGFRYEIPDAREPIAFYLAADGVYEPKTLALILDRLQPGGVFVDIGANIGVFALPAERCV